jgi:hypothetical protein
MPLDFNIGSASVPVSLEIDPTTDHDVFTALDTNTAFPDRDVQIGGISAKLTTPTASFSPGAGATVSMQAAASFTSGLAVYLQPQEVSKNLPLDPALSLDFQNGADDHFILFSLGYTASGSLKGTYPIGLVASASFGVSGQSDSAFAIVHRFDKNSGARDVVSAVVDSLMLPSQARAATDIQTGTWLIAEVDGSVALNLAAQLGYNLSYKRQLQLLGVPHDLGVKIDAAITATLGFTTSGKFLVVLSRPSPDATSQILHLQLMKQKKDGWNIGLALSAGITASPGLPDSIDDFLSSVFGVHGQQVLNDLHDIENWTNGDLGANVAALTTKTATDLLEKVTKIAIKSDADLAQATGLLKNALADWDKLAQNGSSEVQSLVWKLLGNPDATVQQSVVNLLTGLANPANFSQTLSDGLQDLQSRQWLLGLSDAVGAISGLALGQHQAAVQTVANDALNVLNGNIFTQLKDAIASQFDLNAILTATNPAQLTQWVQDRLAAFLDGTVLSSADLKQIQATMKALGTKISDLYDKTKSAINSRYSIDFATKYEMNTADTALIDMEFDMAQAGAAGLFATIMGTGSVDTVFNAGGPIAGVTINEALLTHEIHSAATTHFQMPFFKTDSAHLNDTVAKLMVEQNGAHLVASIDSKDQVQADRYASILELADELSLDNGITPDPSGTMAYEMRLIRSAMSQIELEDGTLDFVESYLADKFPSPAKYTDEFLKNLDITVSNAASNPANNFGDMAVSMQVALTADFLQGWLVKRDAPALLAAQVAASRQIQTFLRKYTALLYFQDLNNLNNNAAAPLLVWSSLPVCAGIDWDKPNLTLNAVDTGKDTYWDFEDPDLVAAMVNLKSTEKQLEGAVSDAYQRLLAAGNPHGASFYGPQFEDAAGALRNDVLTNGPQGQMMAQFHGLLFAESQVIGGIASALKSAAAAVASASADARTEVTGELASFGRSLTTALNSGVSNIYTGQNLMLYGPMLLVELSSLLAPPSAAPKRRAMLQMLSLRPGHSFDLKTFLTGSFPDLKEVAVGQAVVSSNM